MKTLNKLYISLILLSTSLLAVDKSYSFLGIEVGNTFTENKSVPTIGLKYGVQTRKYRTSLSYKYAKKSNVNYQTLVAQVDTGILTNTFRNSSIKPYAGFSVGVIQENNVLNTIETDRGYLYGINTGLTYIFNDALDFDLAYRYLETSKLENTDSLSDVSLSLHYFY